MKNIFRLTAVALLAATLFSACTGAFEDMNTNPKGVSDEELKQDNNYIGMHFIPMMQSKEDLINEIGDLLYHLIVLMVEKGITLEEVEAELEKRSKKSHNLKPERRPIENL